MIEFEEYRTIEEYPNYLFGSLGNIISLWHKKPFKRAMILDKSGYYNLRFTNKDGNKVTRWAHRLLTEAFNGPCPEGKECRHHDGNRLNLNRENLSWATHKENCSDRSKHGTQVKGEKATFAKVTEKDVLWIREKDKEGWSSSEIAKRLPITPRAVRFIRDRETWKHI